MSYLAAVADLTGRARRGEYDLVHLHGIDLSLAVVRALGGARLPVEVTPWCAGPDGEIALIRRRLSHRPVAASLGRVDRFQVMVPTIADELATMGVSRERTVSIPGCVVLPEGGVRPESEPPGVLFGGRFEEQKRVDTLLLAWARTRARSRGVRLVAAGAGSLHGAMKELARELDLGASVELPGNLPDWSERLARCAIFVLASRSEGMSQALLEAMAAGRACVVSDLPENRALFEDAAVYVPVGSVDALAAALDRLLDDPELRRRLGSSARKRAEDVYSIDRLVERHLEVYRGLIARRSRSGGPTPTSESSP